MLKCEEFYNFNMNESNSTVAAAQHNPNSSTNTSEDGPDAVTHHIKFSNIALNMTRKNRGKR